MQIFLCSDGGGWHVHWEWAEGSRCRGKCKFRQHIAPTFNIWETYILGKPQNVFFNFLTIKFSKWTGPSVPSLCTLSFKNGLIFSFIILQYVTWLFVCSAAGLSSSCGHHCTGAELRAECCGNAQGPGGKWCPQYPQSRDSAHAAQRRWWNKRY